jgi:hypothetical protein
MSSDNIATRCLLRFEKRLLCLWLFMAACLSGMTYWATKLPMISPTPLHTVLVVIIATWVASNLFFSFSGLREIRRLKKKLQGDYI